ncbi:MAG: tyrosine-type recombinase/integrase [Alphaproteobacteria bacterium]|nr:tyrosine-type recombinase/integrase [Alphaproteobacteria bacterium]
MKLSDLKCRNTKPSEKNMKLRDGKGLYLLVMKSGGKSWRYDYKLKTNDNTYKNGTFVYGLYPEIPLTEARDLHSKTHKLVSQGIDPNNHKKQQERIDRQNRALTFSHIAQEWMEKRKVEITPKTFSGIERRMEKDVIPEIGNISMQDLSPRDFLDMLKKIESRGAYEMANRARQYCSQILRYAIAIGKAERDFTVDIGDALTVHRVKHQPALQPHEIPEFLKALEYNEARLFSQTRLALKMLMLTFVRPIELASAEWKDFDFENKLWMIPAVKMKMSHDHVVPLATQTLEILNEMKKTTENRQYVFIKQTNPKDHIARDTLSKAIRSLGFQGRHSVHGFRALARTAIREKLGYDSEIIERQLAHAPKTSLGRAYDRTQFIDQRIEMMQEWANYIDGLKK